MRAEFENDGLLGMRSSRPPVIIMSKEGRVIDLEKAKKGLSHITSIVCQYSWSMLYSPTCLEIQRGTRSLRSFFNISVALSYFIIY